MVDQEKLKVLVADDSRSMRLLTRAILEAAGFAVIEAGDGALAIEAYERDAPDVLLIDGIMPRMDGGGVVRHVRRQVTEHWVPIIMMSSLGRDHEIVAGLEAGADDYIVKPVSPDILSAKMRSVQRQLRLHEELHHYRQNELDDQAFAAELVERQVQLRCVDDPRVRSWMVPASHFSGDLILTVKGSDGSLYVLLADATGHGLPAMLTVLPLVPIFNVMAGKALPLDVIAAELNQRLRESVPTGWFVAATLVRMTPDGQAAVWVGGMPPVWLVDDAGTVLHVEPAGNLALGIVAMPASAMTVTSLPSFKGARLIACSDGAIEGCNAAGEMFGTERMLAAMGQGAYRQEPAALRRSLEQFLGGQPAPDDVSLVVVDLQPSPDGRASGRPDEPGAPDAPDHSLDRITCLTMG